MQVICTGIHCTACPVCFCCTSYLPENVATVFLLSCFCASLYSLEFVNLQQGVFACACMRVCILEAFLFNDGQIRTKKNVQSSWHLCYLFQKEAGMLVVHLLLLSYVFLVQSLYAMGEIVCGLSRILA